MARESEPVIEKRFHSPGTRGWGHFLRFRRTWTRSKEFRQELMGHKTIAMTVRYSHLAPKHTLAAVERLDAPTGERTDTTTDTSASPQKKAEVVVLQQTA